MNFIWVRSRSVEKIEGSSFGKILPPPIPAVHCLGLSKINLSFVSFLVISMH